MNKRLRRYLIIIFIAVISSLASLPVSNISHELLHVIDLGTFNVPFHSLCFDFNSNSTMHVEFPDRLEQSVYDNMENRAYMLSFIIQILSTIIITYTFMRIIGERL